jgi:hypothetical protein
MYFKYSDIITQHDAKICIIVTYNIQQNTYNIYFYYFLYYSKPLSNSGDMSLKNSAFGEFALEKLSIVWD